LFLDTRGKQSRIHDIFKNIAAKNWWRSTFWVWQVGGSIPCQVKSKTEKLTPVASLVIVHI